MASGGRSVKMAQRVAVIGAGASGLTAIKCSLDDGISPVCFERTDHIGGLWYFTYEAVGGQSCVMKSTVINTSKEMMCYSDFPIPQHFPNFMHNRRVLEYFKLYAERFGLKKHIKFKTEVLSVKQAKDFDVSGCWDVEIKDLASCTVTTERFDGVFVCTGHHAERHLPKFAGAESFQGKTLHTHEYKHHVGFEGKRVVIIGIGNSGGDIAVELGKVSEQVFLSTRRGSWILNRIGDNGAPIDMKLNTRFSNFMAGVLPINFINSFAESKANQKFDHAVYGLKPNHRLLSQHPSVNDDLPNRIICGSVVVKPNIKRILPTGVEFEDGTIEENIDVIVFATGYIFGFPFIDNKVIEVKENQINLYKYVFPPDLSHTTLAVIGCIQPWGAVMPISEMQCRLATRLWKGAIYLPSREDMWADILKKRREMTERYVRTQRHTIQVDYVPYMDELAEHVGCKPQLGRLWLRKPRLATACFFGPCTPYQYRLHGPGSWEGAERAIRTQWDRVYYPLATRSVEHVSANDSFLALLLRFVLGILVLFVVKSIVF